jgi:hypothetical protein
VPADTLLLAWVKNESVATATALDGWTLDSASTSFLWAEYQTALSAGAYDGHFSYSDPIGWQTAIVGVTPAPPGPAAQSQSVITNQDTPVDITLKAVSPNNFPLTYTVLAQPAHGQLSGVAPDLTYTPNAGYSGDDSFTFKANDGTADSNVAIVSITVRPPNQPPVAQNGTVTVEAGTTAAITLSASDPDDDPLTYTVLTSPAHGLLSGTAPNLTYTPNAGYVGGDLFTFKANDGTTDSNVAQVDISVTAGAPRPAVVNRTGYINGTPLTAHTTAAFNSVGASTLVVFVSGHPSWDSLPVSISSVTDNVGNTWNVLVGPTTWTGSTYTLMSAIYYVNAPVTSATHTVTVNLTNPVPWVMHVFAVSGSDIVGPPIYSPITDPGPGPSTDVISQAITVPADTLLLAWVKNENVATATALDSWTLDSASTSFLWAAYQTALSAGDYHGHFLLGLHRLADRHRGREARADRSRQPGAGRVERQRDHERGRASDRHANCHRRRRRPADVFHCREWDEGHGNCDQRRDGRLHLHAAPERERHGHVHVQSERRSDRQQRGDRHGHDHARERPAGGREREIYHQGEHPGHRHPRCNRRRRGPADVRDCVTSEEGQRGDRPWYWRFHLHSRSRLDQD